MLWACSIIIPINLPVHFQCGQGELPKVSWHKINSLNFYSGYQTMNWRIKIFQVFSLSLIFFPSIAPLTFWQCACMHAMLVYQVSWSSHCHGIFKVGFGTRWGNGDSNFHCSRQCIATVCRENSGVSIPLCNGYSDVLAIYHPPAGYQGIEMGEGGAGLWIVLWQDELFHTKLASHYIDEVLKLFGEDNAAQRLKVARERLQTFLEESQYYHAPVLLSKVHDTELYRECALLYGRVSVHWLASAGWSVLVVHPLRWRSMRRL